MSWHLQSSVTHQSYHFLLCSYWLQVGNLRKDPRSEHLKRFNEFGNGSGAVRWCQWVSWLLLGRILVTGWNPGAGLNNRATMVAWYFQEYNQTYGDSARASTRVATEWTCFSLLRNVKCHQWVSNLTDSCKWKILKPFLVNLPNRSLTTDSTELL